MTTRKVITLSSVKQLIDLNGNSTNVDITFTAKSLDNSDFYALVVDQITLDSGVPLEFKLAKGSISANIISDNNVYQNHFLCLKSDKPCQVEVVIDKKEIQFVNRNIIQPAAQPAVQPFVEPVIHRRKEHFAQIPQNKQINRNKSTSNNNWVIIFAICALGAGGLAYYYFVYSKKKPKMTISPVVSVPQIPIAEKMIQPEIETSNSFSERLSKLLEKT